MKYVRLTAVFLPVILASCATNNGGTLAELRDVKIDIKDAKVEGGLEKAMQGYKRFLKETPESAMTPEAIRRLADLKIEKEYGIVPGEGSQDSKGGSRQPATYKAAKVENGITGKGDKQPKSDVVADVSESDKDFEKRATATQPIKSSAKKLDGPLPEGGDDLQRAGALEAIQLYKKLLAKYPMYERNDQVLYQMSRAYEELGRVEDAMNVMNRMVKEYPRSRYMDEVQFRRGEYFFTHKKFLDAEDAYKAIVHIGVSSSYYELALYKLGWTFYKQQLYEEALNQFIALLDHKVSIGYDFEHPKNKIEKKRLEDTYRVISLSFSNLGGPDAVTDYFSRYGTRTYESGIYSHLGEFYLKKRRYSDAAASYKAFVTLHPFDKVSPHFNMRVIDIYREGGFPKLVIEAKKEFATTYGLHAEYWKHFDPKSYPKVLGYLKTNLKDLAHYYHSLYQDKKFAKTKAENYHEALHWYREFLVSFPKEAESPGINYQLADLLLENKAFGEAAKEYERTAYDYPAHPKASAAGYAAVYSYREYLKVVPQAERRKVKLAIVSSSLKFGDTFPKHEKAAAVLGAAADDLYEMKDFERAISTGHKIIKNYPKAKESIRRGAWIVVAHSSFDLGKYKDAEDGYMNVLRLTAPTDKSRPAVVDNLAASIYKQGEQANKLKDYRAAADHFLRIGRVAPTSKIRPTAEYDAAAALIQLEDWDKAATVLVNFRKNYPKHKLQPEVTKKMAYVYQQAGKLSQAAAEYERIERESKDDAVRREALLTAADLHEKSNNSERALLVYRRYVDLFPKPVEAALETRFKIANLYKGRNETDKYHKELKTIVDIDASAGAERTDRTRYLAAESALVLAEPLYERYMQLKLVKPFQKNLQLKQQYLKEARDAYTRLTDYEVGDVTAAATFHLAEIYYNFSRSLMESERPDNLSALELEQYNLAIEDKAYPFEEKAIDVHKKNLELMSLGIYNEWIEKSLAKLAKLVPARYAKYEESTGFIESIDSFTYLLPKKAPAKSKAQAAAAGGGQPATDQTGSGGQPPAGQPAAQPAAQSPAAQGGEGAASPADGAVAAQSDAPREDSASAQANDTGTTDQATEASPESSSDGAAATTASEATPIAQQTTPAGVQAPNASEQEGDAASNGPAGATQSEQLQATPSPADQPAEAPSDGQADTETEAAAGASSTGAGAAQPEQTGATDSATGATSGAPTSQTDAETGQTPSSSAE